MKPRQLERALTGKFGFSRVLKGKSSDHRYYALEIPNVPVITTMVSHSRQEIGPRILGKIARQLRVNSRYLEGMVRCDNSRADYYEAVTTEHHS